MLKRVLLPAALLLTLLAPASAFANYVCQTEYYPGQFPRIKLTLTTAVNCTGSTFSYWVCDPASPSTSCGGFRYSVPELLSLQSSLVSAAKTQQYVQQSTTTCTGGVGSCFYSIAFKQ